MGVIYFIAGTNITDDPFICELEEKFPGIDIDVFTKMKDLKAKLETQQFPSHNVVILRATSEDALFDIYSMCHLLSILPSVLILPDLEKLTIALGQRIRTNFLFHRDSPTDDILFVAEQFLDDKKIVIPINSQRGRTRRNGFPCLLSHGESKVSNL